MDEELTPLQTAFRKHDVLQCRFCTPRNPHDYARASHPGAFDRREPHPRRIIKFCRCTGYIPIIEAVLDTRQVSEAGRQESQ
jgi:carbon-monoxide dehydrogenase small subunit